MADNRFKNGVYQNRHEQPVTTPVTVNPADLGWLPVKDHWKLNGHELRNRFGWWVIREDEPGAIGQCHTDQSLPKATEALKSEKEIW